MTQWNCYHDDKLKQMYLDGSTFTEICQELNKLFGTQRSRNSVSGRIDRLKLPMRPRPVKTETKPEPRVKKYWNDNDVRKPVLFEPKTGEGITIHQLNNNTCRYMTNDEKRLYCGHQVSHKSYCAGHGAVCYKAKS